MPPLKQQPQQPGIRHTCESLCPVCVLRQCRVFQSNIKRSLLPQLAHTQTSSPAESASSIRVCNGEHHACPAPESHSAPDRDGRSPAHLHAEGIVLRQGVGGEPPGLGKGVGADQEVGASTGDEAHDIVCRLQVVPEAHVFVVEHIVPIADPPEDLQQAPGFQLWQMVQAA